MLNINSNGHQKNKNRFKTTKNTASFFTSLVLQGLRNIWQLFNAQ